MGAQLCAYMPCGFPEMDASLDPSLNTDQDVSCDDNGLYLLREGEEPKQAEEALPLPPATWRFQSPEGRRPASPASPASPVSPASPATSPASVSKKTTSRYAGVSRTSDNKKWRAVCSGVYLGSFHVEEDAARAWDRQTVQMRGANAMTHFPLSDYVYNELGDDNKANSEEGGEGEEDVEEVGDNDNLGLFCEEEGEGGGRSGGARRGSGSWSGSGSGSGIGIGSRRTAAGQLTPGVQGLLDKAGHELGNSRSFRQALRLPTIDGDREWREGGWRKGEGGTLQVKMPDADEDEEGGQPSGDGNNGDEEEGGPLTGAALIDSLLLTTETKDDTAAVPTLHSYEPEVPTTPVRLTRLMVRGQSALHVKGRPDTNAPSKPALATTFDDFSVPHVDIPRFVVRNSRACLYVCVLWCCGKRSLCCLHRAKLTYTCTYMLRVLPRFVLRRSYYVVVLPCAYTATQKFLAYSDPSACPPPSSYCFHVLIRSMLATYLLLSFR